MKFFTIVVLSVAMALLPEALAVGHACDGSPEVGVCLRNVDSSIFMTELVFDEDSDIPRVRSSISEVQGPMCSVVREAQACVALASAECQSLTQAQIDTLIVQDSQGNQLRLADC